MDEEQRQQFQQTADRATIFCLLSFAIGAYIIWVILARGSSYVSSTYLPIAVVGFVHLLGGGIAIYHAVKTGNFARNIPIYGYFLLVITIAVWIISVEITPL